MFGTDLLSMTWRDLLFCHWAVDPGTIEGTLPDRLTVATHEGTAYLGIVPFVMEDISPRGSPIGLTFPELNLRTYVEGPAGPGVYFYNLDADDAIGVSVARRLFNLPYYRASMTVDREGAEGDRAVRFRSRRTHDGVPSARFDVTYRPSGEPFRPKPGSLPAFLVENYRFYAYGRRLYHGEIDHDPWTLRPATVSIRENGLFAASGFDHPPGEPIVHYGESLPVTAGRLRRA